MTKLNKMLTEVNKIIAIKKGNNFKVHSIDELKWDKAQLCFNYPNSETELRVVCFYAYNDKIFTDEWNATILPNDVTENALGHLKRLTYC